MGQFFCKKRITEFPLNQIDKLIIGIGNPNNFYEKTRHNIGKLFIQFLFSINKVQIYQLENSEFIYLQKRKNKFINNDKNTINDVNKNINDYNSNNDNDNNKQINIKTENFTSNNHILIAQTYGFMNRSGLIVSELQQMYKVNPENILIIQDDLDMKFGKVRLRKGGNHGGHNGIKSIINNLNDNNFWRLKIGIGRPESRKGTQIIQHVLGKITEDEMKELNEVVFPLCLKILREAQYID